MNISSLPGIRNLLPWLALILLAAGCGEAEKEIVIPEHIAAMDSVTVIDPDTAAVEKLELVRDREFGSTGDQPVGTIVEFEVDERGRVYIAEGTPGSGMVHVYEPDGSYLTTIGQFGRGPGDLLNTVEMEIQNNRLYNFNGQMGGSQISVFSMEDYSFIETVLFRRNSMEEYVHLARLGPDDMQMQGDRFLMGFRSFMMPGEKPEEPRRMPYHAVSMEGEVTSDKIIDLRRPDRFYPDRADLPGMSYTLPFSRRSLLAVANDGTIRSAWTEDFLIELRDNRGAYRRAIYWPRKNSPLSISEFDYDRSDVIQMEEQLPTETWPALHTLLVDEKNRLWIAAYTDDGLGGMIISEEGDLLAKFDWPEDPMDNPSFKERKMVNGGYYYQREQDEETGLRSVVRYELRTASGERYE